jgi:hypothetical protein
MNDNLPPVDNDPLDGDGGAPAPAPAPKPKRTGSTGSLAPVGDIQVKKKAKTYNTYTLQLSMGQIEAIHSALEKDHANPIADELLALFGYYLKTVPGPGEEEEDVKAQDEQAAAGEEGEEVEDDLPVPMPPGYKGDGRTTVAGEGPEEQPGPGGPGARPGAPTSLPGGEDNGPEDDVPLPAPPRE